MAKNYLNLPVFFFGFVFSQISYAGGFSLKLNSGILAGQANAGSAVVNDPLAIFTNPASAIQQRNMGFALQGTGIFPYTRFRGTTTDPLRSSSLQSIKSRQASKSVFVPAGAVVARLHDRIAFGLVINAPFGAKFDYGPHWGGNRYVVKSALETINATPTFAIKLHDAISFGGGLQVQRSSAVLSSQSSSSNPLAQFLFQKEQTSSRAKLHGSGIGWTAGILFQPICPLKLGFSYRSEIRTHLKGFLSFNDVPTVLAENPALQATRAKSKIKFPQIFTLSGGYDINSKWTTLFDVIRTNWSSIQQIVLSTPINSRTLVVQQKWRDTFFFSAGVNYKYNPCWLFRAGIAYDPKASRSPFRVPGLPDNDKIWTTVGATYSWDEMLSTSLSYGHEFFRKQQINLQDANSGNAGKGNLNGQIREHINLVSLQVNYQF